MPLLLSSSLNLMNKLFSLLGSGVVDAEILRVSSSSHFLNSLFDSTFQVDLVELVPKLTNLILHFPLFYFDHPIRICLVHFSELVFVSGDSLSEGNVTLLRAGAPLPLISFWTMACAPVKVS